MRRVVSLLILPDTLVSVGSAIAACEALSGAFIFPLTGEVEYSITLAPRNPPRAAIFDKPLYGTRAS